MAQTSTKRRNILVSSIIIVVLVISSIATLIVLHRPSSTVKPSSTALYVNVALNQSTVIQGSNLQAQVNVTSTGKPENVTLNSNVGSSGINCAFEPSVHMSNFTSILTMNVPDSTPTDNYTITITASGNGRAVNASSVISVLSAYVTVSGKADISALAGVGVSSLVGIKFTDVQTGNVTTFNFPFSYPIATSNDIGTYSVSLLNEHTYSVTLNYYWGMPNAIGPETAADVGNFTVFATAGETAMPKDFSLG